MSVESAKASVVAAEELPLWQAIRRAASRVARQPLLVYLSMLLEIVPPLALYFLARAALGGGQRLTGFVLGAVPVVLLIVGPWVSAGMMGLYRSATLGFASGLGAFLHGARHYYLRALGGVVGLALISIALGIPVASLAGGAQWAPVLPLWGSADLVGVLAKPYLWLYGIPILLSTFLLTYWSPAVALEDRNLSLGVLASLRLVLRALPATFFLVALNWLVSYGIAALTGSPSWNGLALTGAGWTGPLTDSVPERVMSEIVFAGMLLGLWQVLYRLTLYELYAGRSPWVRRLPERASR